MKWITHVCREDMRCTPGAVYSLCLNLKALALPVNLGLLIAILFKEVYSIRLSAMIQTCQHLTLTVILSNVSMKPIKDPLSKEEKYSNFCRSLFLFGSQGI